MNKNKSIWYIATLCIGVLFLSSLSIFSSQKVDYNTDVKPIFNKKCIACHGGVKKNGGFSLLFEEEAKAKLKSGHYAIVPHKPNDSEIIKRINATDIEERMPYKHDPLSKQEIKILTDWIKQGAPWGIHWSYKKVNSPQIPSSKNSWVKNNIDSYIFRELQNQKMKPSTEADAATLARRVSLDLLGFKADDSILSIYTAQPTDDNYATMVDSLLASPHYGEKWAAMWLDLARYADTKGYEKDEGRTIWRYKNWLINALNKDMSYDQFITEQLAGDLLPNATDDQLIATAFHRNTMTNDEGGTDNEEYRTAAVIDRVNTTWETIMGTTFACVQCHSHPYDPFTHKEYYQFYAFFNNTRDADTPEEYPLLRHFDSTHTHKLDSLKIWLKESTTPEEIFKITRFLKTYQPARYSAETDSLELSALVDTKWLAMRNGGQARMYNVALENNDQILFTYRTFVKSGKLSFRLDSVRGPEIANFTWDTITTKLKKTTINLKPIPGNRNVYLYFESKELKNSLAYGIRLDWFHFTKKINFANTIEGQKSKETYWDLVNINTPGTPILFENPVGYRRTTQLFERGNWLVKADTVEANVPILFNPIASDTKDRLALANWITAPDHPLTARVLANRLWEQLWGIGLVETLEDFGSQGTIPINQPLLDYMAYALVHHHHWSIKGLLKEIVTSAAYRQDSKATADVLNQDPYNRYASRGPRIRLHAEQLRDQILAACGFVDSLYTGPPVMPYQPNGVWQSPYSNSKWVKSENNNQYRRAIYTYWKRTSAYPAMTNFDATEREVCLSRRIRTNTPLQALTLLNDSAYIDLANHLSSKYIDLTTDSLAPDDAIKKIYHTLLGKELSTEKLYPLATLYYKSFIHYCRTNHSINESKKNALSLVTSAIFNLDEVITKS